MEYLDWQLNEFFRSEEECFECPECGKPTSSDDYCSGTCFESSMR